MLSAHDVPIAPSGYYAFKSRPPSPRAERDELLLVQLRRIHADRKLGRAAWPEPARCGGCCAGS